MEFIQHNLFWILPVVVIDAVLKLIALWKAGRNNQLAWFVALGILNTAGILPVVYLIFFQCDFNKGKKAVR